MRFMQAAKHGGSQDRVDRIVIHGTVSPCKRGGAKSVASYFQSQKAGGSAHYTVDPGEIVQSLKETVVGYHAPPNTGSVGIEMCDPQKGAGSRWQDDDHEEMLQRAAALVRQVAKRWDVPLHRLTVDEVKAGKRGICGHVDVSKAFRQSDHTDPGDAFPWDHFMFLVRSQDEPEKTWTETLMENLPVLREGDDNYDVKTVRWLLGARGGSTERLDLLNTRFTPGLTTEVVTYQLSKGLEGDGIVGKLTWSALHRRKAS